MIGQEAEKTKTKYKVKLLAMLLLLILVVGSEFEYHQAILPLNQQVVVHIPGKAEYSLVTKQSDVELIEKEDKLAKSAPVSSNQGEQKRVIPSQKLVDEHKQALSEFLDYMHKVNRDVSEVSQKPAALDYIKQNESSNNVTDAKSKQQFLSDRIEVYDSDKGVESIIVVPQENKNDSVGQAEEKSEVKQGNALSEVADDVSGDVAAAIEAEEVAKANEEAKLKQRVDSDLSQMTEDGEEAPVVLIPGLQNGVDSTVVQ